MRHTKSLAVLAILQIVSFLVNISAGEENCHVNKSLLEVSKKLSRKKRYLAFPTGTNFVTTITLLKAIQVKEPKNWNLDLEFDMIWPIPDQEKLHKKPWKPARAQNRIRRHRRDLYSNIELAFASQGLPGSDCVLRTICEARTFLNSPGVSFLEDIIRVVLSHEDEGVKLDKYDIAYRKNVDCDIEYPCPISILDLLLSNSPEFT